uniref:Uncharacterized protein n=1 Tax=Laticauda laticaudata TaxID=8630 RepID=A0A8C5SG45_LATLA
MGNSFCQHRNAKFNLTDCFWKFIQYTCILAAEFKYECFIPLNSRIQLTMGCCFFSKFCNLYTNIWSLFACMKVLG